MATTLDDILLTRQWPATQPDRLRLYSAPTSNGVKPSIMPEETGLQYEPHAVNIGQTETRTLDDLPLNRNSKIPAIIDPDGPAGRPFALFESAAIRLYLAEKTGQSLPREPAGGLETIQWLLFQMAAVGPMLGQLGSSHTFAGRAFEDKRPLERDRAEAARLLRVLETRRGEREWIAGDTYAIADSSRIGWVRAINALYLGSDLVGRAELSRVQA